MCFFTDRVWSVAIQSFPETSNSWIDISSGLLTPLIALLAAFIAWQQYKINKLRLRHETYERRVKIYKNVQKFLSEISANGHTKFDRCHEFYSEASEAAFLFDNEVMEFIDHLYDRGIELAERREELYPSDGSSGVQGAGRGVVASRRAELFKWFVNQLSESKELFRKHIGIKST